ncbi:unnamed protein product [Somion occarium]|uniref:AAA+ ATPase domain-containing protein n=1 Tax=Somion occarium TaxID=3059160 RepID=A0ABP1DBP5_9APHY
MESFGEPSMLLCASATSLVKPQGSFMDADSEPFVPTSLLLDPKNTGNVLDEGGFGSPDATLLGDASSSISSFAKPSAVPSPKHVLTDLESDAGFGTATLLNTTSTSTSLLSTSNTASSSCRHISLTRHIEQDDSTSGFGSATLLNDSFVENGLLSDSNITYAASGPVEDSQSSFALSQSQDLPEVADIIRPYVSTTGAIASSSGTVVVQRSTVKATTFDGKSVFFRRKPKRIGTILQTAPGRSEKIGKLLDVPIHRLMENLSRDTAAKLTLKGSQPQASTSSRTEDTLWVDRYRPERFIELVGDDRVHREVMAWVKEWDWCVFGNKKGKKRMRDDENLDEWKRPREKLLLISGPPGLGKTTLAHVVAKHAGYGVFEINASDARSAQIVDERIRPALESGSMIGSNKPTLLVIDEIDGATGGSDNSGGFIHKLIQLIQERPRRKGRNEPKRVLPILRPIVCICNDLYASSLSKLRPHARIIRMSRPNDLHIIKRLRTICDEEGMKVESRALTTLVGVAQGDMRGCLNTLQMIKSRYIDVTECVIRKATAGMKEAEASQTSVLNDLFTPMSKKRSKDLGLTEEQESRYVTRLSREIEASGAMDKVAIGCFEHYANLRRHDGNFSHYLKANEWLSCYDLMSGEMRSEREYSALQYLSYFLVPFYPLFQERGAPRVERPKQDWEHYTQMKTNEEIYDTLAHNLRSAATRLGGAYRHFASQNLLHLEFAPFINRIISPPLRPVNSQVIKPEERILLSRLVDIMVALELRFFLEKTEEGQNTFRLDPPIDVFVTYDGKRATDLAVSRFAVRQLVANEIDAKWVNQQAVETVAASKPKRNFFGRQTASAYDPRIIGDGKLMPGGRDTDAPPNKRARKEEDIVEKVPTDFFGRPIVATGNTTKPASRKAHVEKKYRVSYKFHEGNSAAVRKPVKVSAFL